MDIEFSIVTVNFNNYEGLYKTYISVLEQKEKNFEWIIVDGFSNDELTINLLSEIKDTCKNSTIIIEQDNGPYDAMNKGLLLSKGKYLLFLNSGDIFFDSNTLCMVKNETSKDSDLIYGDYIEYFSECKQVYRKAKSIYKIYIGMPTNHQSIYVKRSSVDFMFDDTYKVSADYDFLCKLYKKEISSSIIHKPLCRFDMTGLSINNSRYARYEYEKIRVKELKVPLFLSKILNIGQGIWASYKGRA